MLYSSWERARSLLFGSHRRRLVTVGAAAITAAAVGIPALAAGPHPTPTGLTAPAVSVLAAASSSSSTPPASPSVSASPTPSASASASKPAATRKATATATAATKAAIVLREVAKLKGSPYVFGATGPRTFDCAGLTQFVYAKIGVKLVNYVPTQLAKAKVVPHSKQRPGDLVFFLSGDFAYHVGIYAGNHKMWDAPTEGQTVGLHEIWDDGYVVGQFY
ncbi:MAG: peptidase P60 [Hamadaea sp.]|nr:peptidase P60 [Hamadaea sp.]NUR51951.1 peptidase P60 [Hamadaea sp.]NUT08652.1 peptidase P60 [Hamadaea sp.]